VVHDAKPEGDTGAPPPTNAQARRRVRILLAGGPPARQIPSTSIKVADRGSDKSYLTEISAPEKILRSTGGLLPDSVLDRSHPSGYLTTGCPPTKRKSPPHPNLSRSRPPAAKCGVLLRSDPGRGTGRPERGHRARHAGQSSSTGRGTQARPPFHQGHPGVCVAAPSTHEPPPVAAQRPPTPFAQRHGSPKGCWHLTLLCFPTGNAHQAGLRSPFRPRPGSSVRRSDGEAEQGVGDRHPGQGPAAPGASPWTDRGFRGCPRRPLRSGPLMDTWRFRRWVLSGCHHRSTALLIGRTPRRRPVCRRVRPSGPPRSPLLIGRAPRRRPACRRVRPPGLPSPRRRPSGR